jgi:AraC-like DNA-binding protein
MQDCLEIILGGYFETALQTMPILIRQRLDCSYRHYDKGGLSGTQLRRARAFIDGNLTFKLTVANIAGVAALSKYHFGKAFKQSTGMTVHSYVLARRMWRAQELPAKSDLSTRTGFSPASYRSMTKPSSVLCVAAQSQHLKKSGG